MITRVNAYTVEYSHCKELGWLLWLDITWHELVFHLKRSATKPQFGWFWEVFGSQNRAKVAELRPRISNHKYIEALPIYFQKIKYFFFENYFSTFFRPIEKNILSKFASFPYLNLLRKWSKFGQHIFFDRSKKYRKIIFEKNILFSESK